MKKILSIFVAAVMAAGMFTACSTSTEENVEASGRLQIVTTIFPEYDWVMNVLGDTADNADVTMLLDSGVDLHSFQPTADDIMKIATCDMFIYVGGESDEWVEDALSEAVNPDMVVINLLDVLGDSVMEEELVEGMEGEEEEEEGEEEEGPEYDEHVWLSLRNAAVLTQCIADQLCVIDPANTDEYAANAASYIEELNTLLFGDRFPFRYMTEDYGLDYYAAFVGCSAETEASFETIMFLAGKVDELGLNTVLTIEGTDHRIAETVVENTASSDQQILSLDSMQSVTAEDVANGASYMEIMRSNLDILRQALQ